MVNNEIKKRNNLEKRLNNKGYKLTNIRKLMKSIFHFVQKKL